MQARPCWILQSLHVCEVTGADRVFLSHLIWNRSRWLSREGGWRFWGNWQSLGFQVADKKSELFLLWSFSPLRLVRPAHNIESVLTNLWIIIITSLGCNVQLMHMCVCCSWPSWWHHFKSDLDVALCFHMSSYASKSLLESILFWASLTICALV